MFYLKNILAAEMASPGNQHCANWFVPYSGRMSHIRLIYVRTNPAHASPVRSSRRQRSASVTSARRRRRRRRENAISRRIGSLITTSNRDRTASRLRPSYGRRATGLVFPLCPPWSCINNLGYITAACPFIDPSLKMVRETARIVFYPCFMLLAPASVTTVAVCSTFLRYVSRDVTTVLLAGSHYVDVKTWPLSIMFVSRFVVLVSVLVLQNGLVYITNIVRTS